MNDGRPRQRQALLAHTLLALALALGCDGQLRAFERASAADAGAGGALGGGGATSGSGATEPLPAGGATDQEPTGGAPSGSPAPLLIDDFEDGDTRGAGTLGWWYPVNDGSGRQGHGIEPVAERGLSYAIHTHGDEFTDWGAAFGINFVGERVLDLTGYSELRFWARTAPAASREVSVRLLDARDFHYIQDITVSELWTEHRLPLASFRTFEDAPFDPTQLEGLQFFFWPNQAFDLWLDDLELVP